jgi:NDP-sugar pyrophosphorylase family protein
MAGRGKRFVDAGYDKPKPFIDVKGEPMIARVINNLDIWWKNKYIFVCLKDFIDKYGNEFKSYIGNINHEIIMVDQVTEGAACSCLLAKNLINNNEELVITDCDHLTHDINWLLGGVDFFNAKNADGGIWNLWNDNPKWSYVRISNGVITEVAEKSIISNIANTGTYWFKHGKDFVDAAERMIQRNDRTKGEFYVAPVYNYMIADGKKILPYFTNQFVGLGTPEDLEKYLKDNK